MAEGGVRPSHAGVGARPNGDRIASHALQAGLLALLCVFVLLATFGPWFNLVVAHGLAGAAAVAGALGLVWTHAASHQLRRSGSRAGVRTAGLGGLASALAVGVSAYLTGLLIVLLIPAVLALGLALLVVFLALHFSAVRVDREASP